MQYISLSLNQHLTKEWELTLFKNLNSWRIFYKIKALICFYVFVMIYNIE